METTATGITLQITPEMQKQADEQWQKNVDAYKGQAGEVYLSLERKLDDLKAKRDGGKIGEDEKNDVEFQINQLVNMLSILDLDVGVLTRQVDKQAAVRLHEMDDQQQAKYKDTIKSNILHEIPLSEVLAKATAEYQKQERNNTPQGVKRRVAAQQLRLMVQKLIDQEAA